MSTTTLRLTGRGPLAQAAAAMARARAGRTPTIGALLGLEHEYRVFDGSGAQVDFRAILPRLAVQGRRLDPGDAHSCRLRWGAALTADELEAEIALPPIPAQRGAATLVRDLAERARADVAALLPAGHTLAGYSTHLSIAMSTELADALAPRYAQTFAPAMMLLLDGPEAPGLLVRPRPGRLELGGDFRDGDGLRAAMLFAVGSARALAGGRDRDRVPVLAIRPEPAVDRYGWYVDRAVFGADLYAGGRAALLPLAGGSTITAGELLALTWTVARRALRDLASAADLALVDSIVAGRAPLPVEVGRAPRTVEVVRTPGAGAGRTPSLTGTAPRPGASFRAPEGAILDDVVRPDFRLRATLATWEFAAFEISGARSAAASVPRADLGAFLVAASTGLLDRPIGSFLAGPSAGTRLATHAQATGPARLYDGIGDPRGLLATEPDGSRSTAISAASSGAASVVGAAVVAARLAGGLAGLDVDDADAGGGRPGKRRPRDRREPDDQQPARTDPPAQPGPRVPPPTPLAATVPLVAAVPLVVAAPAAALPVIPIILGGAGVTVVAAVLLATGVLTGQPAPSPAVNPTAGPTATTDARSTSAATEAPVQTAAVPGGPPPIAETRIAGIYTDGPSDSFHLVVTPGCAAGACDGSATILSLPFAADSPRGAISMAFSGTLGTYAGSGTATVPFCRTVAGRLLTVSQTYALEAFRVTEQQLVDGQWVATRLEGLVTTGAASVAGDGTTCTANEFANPVVLQRIASAPDPGATPPPLAAARFGGTYAMAPEAASAMTIVPGCVLGACDGTLFYEAFLNPAERVTTSAPLTLAGGRYSGTGVSTGVLCTATARVDVTHVFTDLEVTAQAVVDGQWVATSLTGTVRRLAFRGPDCSGAEESTPVTLSRTP